MKKLFAMAVCLIPFLIHAQGNANTDLTRARELLQAREIKQVVVHRIPDDVTTMTNVTQDSMRKDPFYTITLKEGFEPELKSLLDGVTAATTKRESDLRWGLLLYDQNGREVTSLFVDHFGKLGYINGDRVEFNSNMSERMRSFVRNLR